MEIRRRPPPGLRDLALSCFIKPILQCADLPSVKSFLELLPENLKQPLYKKLKLNTSTENSNFQQIGNIFGCFLSSVWKNIVLEDNIYSHPQIIHFALKNIKVCAGLERFEVGSRISNQNLDDVKTSLLHVSTLQSITSIKLNIGFKVLKSNDDLSKFILNLETSKIRELMIPYVSLDKRSIDALLKLKSLKILSLDNSEMSTVHVVQLLTGLPDLLSLSAVWGRTNRVLPAISSLTESNKLNLKHLFLREPPRIRMTSLQNQLQNLTNIKMVWNILEIIGMNLLYLIQLSIKIQETLNKLTSLELLECEFLHPATLDPVARQPNLKHLSIINSDVIGDEMFFEVPELASSPFSALQTLHVEGNITSPLVLYLTEKSKLLETVHIKSTNSKLDGYMFNHFYVYPKSFLKSFQVEFISHKQDDIIKTLEQIALQSPSLVAIGCLQGLGNVSEEQKIKLKCFIKNNNMNIDVQ
ncbi:uncharacterized protein LOC111697405 [Eurytemora carolleeae]|uniref:uncharacterized protein LOC111697405 n=1 Tax=Eurytemora carolleeae TaxID=1294199 RepID=UPI000C781D00|nr:uncharacterized protein LOC111697405 [Eurytemora carolleeae]|eukprot:XP_023323185.1 uncharacterized protein LOC111697405 [Eurytemora affinis]